MNSHLRRANLWAKIWALNTMVQIELCLTSFLGPDPLVSEFSGDSLALDFNITVLYGDSLYPDGPEEGHKGDAAMPVVVLNAAVLHL